jgi:hypothetical protein
MTDTDPDPGGAGPAVSGDAFAPGPPATGNEHADPSPVSRLPPSAPIITTAWDPGSASAPAPSPAQEAPRPRADPLPGRAWGIVSLVLAVLPLLQLVGLVAGVVGLVLSMRAGRRNWAAVAGIAVSVLLLAAIGVFVIAFAFTGYDLFGGSFGSVVTVCSELGSGEHVVDGLTYTCG